MIFFIFIIFEGEDKRKWSVHLEFFVAKPVTRASPKGQRVIRICKSLSSPFTIAAVVPTLIFPRSYLLFILLFYIWNWKFLCANECFVAQAESWEDIVLHTTVLQGEDTVVDQEALHQEGDMGVTVEDLKSKITAAF